MMEKSVDILFWEKKHHVIFSPAEHNTVHIQIRISNYREARRSEQIPFTVLIRFQIQAKSCIQTM